MSAHTMAAVERGRHARDRTSHAHLVAPCVVIPAFDAAPTVAGIALAARRHVERVVVVDDGSRDGTAQALAALADRPGVEVVTHPSNRGKGSALRTGFDRARALGCTHVVTIDADGQHDPDDLDRVLDAVHAHPGALVLGVRRLERGVRAWKSRVLRAHSNTWVRLATGAWLPDTQTGFRGYPLAALEPLDLVGVRYDLEVEVIVKLVRAGTPVVGVPVATRYDTEVPSRFRTITDSLVVLRRFVAEAAARGRGR